MIPIPRQGMSGSDVESGSGSGSEEGGSDDGDDDDGDEYGAGAEDAEDVDAKYLENMEG